MLLFDFVSYDTRSIHFIYAGGVVAGWRLVQLAGAGQGQVPYGETDANLTPYKVTLIPTPIGGFTLASLVSWSPGFLREQIPGYMPFPFGPASRPSKVGRVYSYVSVLFPPQPLVMVEFLDDDSWFLADPTELTLVSA
jgi:hypothetical protein